mmetsp:Transcript_11402/g.21337  ORF Transcript_11402/g.21337 Transcript_11402/m.21337 type:complete len:310 (+) Transcript_11402:76-1005(+)
MKITTLTFILLQSVATHAFTVCYHGGAFPSRGTLSSSDHRVSKTKTLLFSAPENPADSGSENNDEGFSLASDFAKILQERNIQLDDEDLEELNDDDDEDDDEEEDLLEEEDVDDVTISDDQVYRELDERVLETAGGFVDLLSGVTDDDDDDDEDKTDEKPKIYEPPKVVPDSSLTAGEVVMTVLEALNHNDVPTPNRGVEILFGYSSAGSAISQAIDIEGMTPAEYAMFLKEEYEYKILFDHAEVLIEKGDYSFDKKKAFFTARLKSPDDGDFTSVNFILSTEGMEEDDCWLIDSLLIRPEGMRRRRRR